MRIVTIPAPCVARETRNTLCNCGAHTLGVLRYYADDDFSTMLGASIRCPTCGRKESRDSNWLPVTTLVLTEAPTKIVVDEDFHPPLG